MICLIEVVSPKTPPSTKIFHEKKQKKKEPPPKKLFSSLFGLRLVKHTSAARFRVATKTTHHKKTTTQNTHASPTPIYTKNGSHYHGISG